MHSWNLTETAAVELQERLAKEITLSPLLGFVKYVAGVDVAYSETLDVVVAAAVVLDANTLEVVERSTANQSVAFPYIPGLFSFRELPPVLSALNGINTTPQLIVCDGHGIAHPRRFGLASHLGLLTDIPCIGCAKTPLLNCSDNIASTRGSIAGILLGDEVVGSVLRTQNGIKPVYVSPGHRITLRESSDWVLRLTTKYRLPETTRQADQMVKIALKKLNG